MSTREHEKAAGRFSFYGSESLGLPLMVRRLPVGGMTWNLPDVVTCEAFSGVNGETREFSPDKGDVRDIDMLFSE